MNINNFYTLKYSFCYKNKIHLLNDEIIKMRQNEVYFFHKELKIYGFNIKDLCKDKPDFKTRNILINIAFFINENPDLFKFIVKNRSLPVKKLSFEVKESSLFIDRWQGYIIAYLLIISNKRYHNLRNYLNVEEASYSEDLSYESKKDNLSGINMLNNTKSTSIILTSYGLFLKIVPHSSYDIGEIVIGKLSKSFKFLIKIVIALLLMCGIAYSAYYYSFKSPKNIVILDLNTHINVTINRFNKVIDVSTDSVQGKKLIKNCNKDTLYSDIDLALSSLLETALQTNLIFDYDKVSIFVNKNPLDFDSLLKTMDILKSSHLDLRVNNNGNSFYLN